jgi:predicted CxxxxCH...CXXCH cytochrome family protein
MKISTLRAFAPVVAAAALLICMGCSDPAGDTELRSPHPEGWADDDSPDFHGEQVSDPSVCGVCHGEDYLGGNSGVSCYDCHESYPHASGWLNDDSPDFHGDQIVDLSVCEDCHYDDDSDSWSCWDCHQYPHLNDWASPGTADFHGTEVSGNGFNTDACEDCHYNSDSDSWSCWDCHAFFPHGNSILNDQHGGLLQEVYYEVWVCQTCHNSDYTGGAAGVSCYSCHQYGPEACNTCHGDFNEAPDDTASWAPPDDMVGNDDPSIRTVGAHEHLVNGGDVGGPYSCTLCHLLPDSVDAVGHLEQLPAHAEITFGVLATDSSRTDPMPTWNPIAETCSNTYCHGNFPLGNQDNDPALWTNQDGSQIECGTCHAMPPPPPQHTEFSDDCNLCHGSVVNDDNVSIENPALHVNGQTNYNF